MSGGKKEAAPSGSSLKETIEKAKETIPLGAGSRYVTIILFAYKTRLLKEFLQWRRAIVCLHVSYTNERVFYDD